MLSLGSLQLTVTLKSSGYVELVSVAGISLRQVGLWIGQLIHDMEGVNRTAVFSSGYQKMVVLIRGTVHWAGHILSYAGDLIGVVNRFVAN
jgi:hypothetical protein